MPAPEVPPPSDLWEAAGNLTTTTLKERHLIRLASEHRDVLAGLGVDAFEGPALGVEVPEVARHGVSATAYRVPGVGQ